MTDFCDSTKVALTVKKNKCVLFKTEILDEDESPITDLDNEYPPAFVLIKFVLASYSRHLAC